MKENFSAPVAKKRLNTFVNFNDKRVDNYHWLRDVGYPKITDRNILDYLKEENLYAKQELSKNKKLIDKIYKEIKARIKEDDETVPLKKGEYFYYSYIKKGIEYWVHARKYKSIDNKEEVILDENKLAKDLNYFKATGIQVSPNHKLLSYSIDKRGDEIFQISIKNLETNELLTDKISNTFGIVIWHENNQGFFYIPVSENWRAKKVYYHQLGTDCKNDKLIYEEKDKTYTVSIYKTNSRKYLVINTGSKEENECYYIDLTTDHIELKLFLKRKKEHLYSIHDHNDDFYILTNDLGKNFRIAKVHEKNIQKKWKDFISCTKERYIRGFELYKDHIVLTSSNNNNGLLDLEVINLQSNFSTKLAFPDDSYHVSVVFTTYEADGFRFYYSSLKTPQTVKEYNFSTGKKHILKMDEIPDGFKQNEYQVKRLYARARDGKSVPISLIYRKSKVKTEGENPLYLYGYGSYGYAVPLMFRKSIFSLIDRGFIYAIAHIRGGDDLGHEWYESAKFLIKKNTFYDFIDSAKYLIERGYTKKGAITIAGGSAGGMLVGFCINEEPHLFKTAVAHVPFVDVLNTMLDENLPLTPGEFKEWGDPKNEDIYYYMKSYSPYDNIKKQIYPNLFVTAGLSDPRVTYWEPAKWIAKLREYNVSNSTIVLKINMDAGHGGKSGRYTYLWEVAEEYAFVIAKSEVEINL